MSGYDDLAGLLTVRPLTIDLPAPTYSGWGGSPFSASWTSTVELLATETAYLKPSRLILEAGFTEAQLRQDGMPRAQARPSTDGVVLTLVGTPHGDLRYPCSTYGTWQANVRAIALSLERLRAVDRYGVTRRGEQYSGWKQLEAPGAARGRDLIAQHGSRRAALAATHPDNGGDPNDFLAVQEAQHG